MTASWDPAWDEENPSGDQSESSAQDKTPERKMGKKYWISLVIWLISSTISAIIFGMQIKTCPIGGLELLMNVGSIVCTCVLSINIMIALALLVYYLVYLLLDTLLDTDAPEPRYYPLPSGWSWGKDDD